VNSAFYAALHPQSDRFRQRQHDIGWHTKIAQRCSASSTLCSFEPLAYPHPGRLLWLANYNKVFKNEIVDAADFLDWRAQAHSLDKMVAYDYSNETIAYGNDANQSTIAQLTGDFWGLSGARPAAGRLFTDEDRDVVVLSHAIFQRRFGADPGIIGKTVVLDGQQVTVVGILPENFRFLFPHSGAHENRSRRG
jgi:hypothetical protein